MVKKKKKKVMANAHTHLDFGLSTTRAEFMLVNVAPVNAADVRNMGSETINNFLGVLEEREREKEIRIGDFT